MPQSKVENLLTDDSRLFRVAETDDADACQDIIFEASSNGLLKAVVDYVHSVEEKTALQVACESGSVAVVDTLLDAGASLIIEGIPETDAFLAALQKDNTEICELIVEKYGNDFLVRNSSFGNQKFYLHCACLNGNVDAVVFLLHHGGEVAINRRDPAMRDCTAMEIACSMGHLSVIKLLLAAGANICSDHSLRYSCEYGNYEVVKLFLMHDDLTQCFGQVFNSFSSRVYVAVCAEIGLSIQLSSRWQYDLNQLDEFDVRFDAVALLLHESFDSDVKNDFHLCLLHGVNFYHIQVSLIPFTRLLVFESMEVIHALMDYGVMTHDLVNTFFVTACIMKRYDIAEILLQSALFHVAFDNRSEELCRIISNAGEDRTVEILIRGRVDINMLIDKDMETTLFMFVCRCMLERSVALLIKAGATVNNTDINGCNELHYLMHGAKHHYCKRGLSAVEVLGRLEKLKQLLQMVGVDPEHHDGGGLTPEGSLNEEDWYKEAQNEAGVCLDAA